MSETSHDLSSDGCAAVWDAGELSCGELLIELRKRMRSLQPGQRLHLTALDSAARFDILAWCRMTGHKLVARSHPIYVIERKEE
ncbi:MAG: sulfurtransferase TusA family protein [Pirellulaceae bacterium]|nr:sulfurtransferase TusA family protein [Planctomycetales bacterium]